MSDATQEHWIGFDLGGTKMLATVFRGEFEQVGRKRRKTRDRGDKGLSTDRLVDTIEKALQSAEVEKGQIAGIGVGCPGPLDLNRGVVLEAPNLSWRNVPLKDVLEEKFGCPAVIANDVDAGVYGEYRFGAGKAKHCLLGVFPGTGVGGGCVYEGRIFRSRTSSCLEIGHIPVVPGGPRCGCGQLGCLEAVASRLAISAQAAQAAFRGQAPHLRRVAGTDLSDIRSGVLAEAIGAGDTVIEEIVREASRFIGQALGGVIHLLGPDVVVLGGGLVEAMPDLILPAVEKAARKFVLPSFVDSFKVVAAKLGDDATVLGAAAWAREVIRSGQVAVPVEAPK